MTEFSPIVFLYDSPQRGLERREAVFYEICFGTLPEHGECWYFETRCVDRAARRCFPVDRCNFIKLPSSEDVII